MIVWPLVARVLFTFWKTSNQINKSTTAITTLQVLKHSRFLETYVGTNMTNCDIPRRLNFYKTHFESNMRKNVLENCQIFIQMKGSWFPLHSNQTLYSIYPSINPVVLSTTDALTTISLLPLSSPSFWVSHLASAQWPSPIRFMLSSHIRLCLPLLHPPGTVSCNIVLESPDNVTHAHTTLAFVSST